MLREKKVIKYTDCETLAHPQLNFSQSDNCAGKHPKGKMSDCKCLHHPFGQSK